MRLLLFVFLFISVNSNAQFELAGSTEPVPLPPRTPSRYYTWTIDSGILDAKYLASGLTVDHLKKALGPHGSFKAEGSGLVFSFADGGDIKINQENGKVSEINFLHKNYFNENEVKSKFQAITSNPTVGDQILRRNPYFEDETVVRNTLVGVSSPAKLFRTNFCKAMVPQSGVSFLPKVDGKNDRYHFLVDSVELKRVDWIGLQTLPHTMQKEVTDFVNQPETSERYIAARAILSKHPDFKLLEAARRSKTQVYALDVEPDYLASNPPKDDLVAGVTNRIWSQQLPVVGKGLVFGREEHFSGPSKASVQDFYSRRAPNVPLTIFEGTDLCSLSKTQQAKCKADLSSLKAQKKCDSFDDFRCIRRNLAFASRACSAELGLDSREEQKPTSSSPATR